MHITCTCKCTFVIPYKKKIHLLFNKFKFKNNFLFIFKIE